MAKRKLNPVVSAEKMALFAKLERCPPASGGRTTDFDARLPLTREAHRLLRELRKVR